MNKIHILHGKTFTPNENAFLAPLRRTQKILKQDNIHLFFFNQEKEALFDTDILFLSSKFFSTWWRRFGFERIKDFLLRAKLKVDSIFWFDLSDSTGTTHFKVLPYVDKYVKSQILKDKTRYQQKYYGMRVATDFYHHAFDIEDPILDEPHLNILPTNEDLDKIFVGWNSGLTYYGRWRPYVERAMWHEQRLHQLFKPRFYSPTKKRNKLCSGRFGCTYERNTVSEPRRRIKEKLQKTITMNKVNMQQYFREMRHSYACLSPFGLGEISLRDFEIVLSGAAMVKQNMDHLDTWPNLWETGKTYLDFKWDLSDLESKINYAKSHPEVMRIFADAAQKKYHAALQQKRGPGSFTEYLLDLIA